uniref:Uncharacterized protein n=1 Tax=Corethron hystrix TaxID=216773 RepID=A0A7S1FZX0_9STRA
MIRQWHSIGQAWDLMEAREKEDKIRWWEEKRGIRKAQMISRFSSPVYERVGFFRSDVLYRTSINISDGNAVVPLWNNNDQYLTDRMFYGLRHYASRWQGNTRFNFVPTYVKTHFGQKHKLHSERFLYFLMRGIPLTFDGNICFVRVRSGGRVKKQDCKMQIMTEKLFENW